MSDESKAIEEKIAESTIPVDQHWFIEKMQALGYTANEEGMCYGLAVMGLQAMRLGKVGLDSFNRRLEQIHAIPLQAFKQKLMDGDPALRTDILAFFDGVELSHQAELHPEFFGGVDLHVLPAWPSLHASDTFEYPCYVYVRKEDEGKLLFVTSASDAGRDIPVYDKDFIANLGDASYRRLNATEAGQFAALFRGVIPATQDLQHAASLVRSVTMEENKDFIVPAESFSGAYHLDTLEQYFARLAKQATQPVELLLTSSSHAISVGYDFILKRWIYIDANHLPAKYVEGNREIAQKVLVGLSRNGVAIFDTKIIQSEKAPLREEMVRWKASLAPDIFAITPETVAALDSSKASLLHVAARNGHAEMVLQLILEGKADINQAKEKGSTPLYLAVQNGHMNVVRILVAQHADVNQARENGLTPLYVAAENGHTAIFSFLLEQGANIHQTDENGASLLCIAVEKGALETVALLLERGANPKQADKNGSTPFLAAAWQGHLSVLALLLKQELDINQTADNGFTALHIAVEGGETAVVQFLLENSASMDIADKRGMTPLSLASKNGHVEIMRLLLEKHAALGKAVQDPMPLYTAAENGQAGVLSLLLEYGADLNKGVKGVTPLFIAARNGHAETVAFLLQHNATVASAAGLLGLAAAQGRTSVLAVLLEHGMAVNSVMPLYVAAQNGHIETVTFLLEKSSQAIDQANASGVTPFLAAAEKGHAAIMQLLLKKDAAINQVDNSGATALFIAAEKGHEETVKFLLAKRAAIDRPNEKGITPLQAAEANGHLKVAQLIRKAALISTLQSYLKSSRSNTFLPHVIPSEEKKAAMELLQFLAGKGKSVDWEAIDKMPSKSQKFEEMCGAARVVLGVEQKTQEVLPAPEVPSSFSSGST